MILLIFSICTAILSVALLLLSLLLFFEYIFFQLKQGKEFCVKSLNIEKQARNNVKVAVLIPAHNEERGIESTIDSVQKAIKVQDRIIVIADNCNDSTASVARSLGAIVVERTDIDNRGKGYALDYGLKYLDSNPPDVVVCIDADCQVDTGSIEYLAQIAAATGRPVQSLYLFKASAEPMLKQRIVAFATKIRNYVRPLGASSLGIPSLLLGSGMAFPWSVIKSTDIASSNLVEDIKLGYDLAITGFSPIFYPAAKVTSYLPNQDKASESQKTRWEQGHLLLIREYFPHLMVQALKQKRLDLSLLALDLLIPPMTLFVLGWFFMLSTSILVMILGGWLFPFLASALSGIFLIISVFGAWISVGQKDIPFKFLLAIPLYIFWKLLMYLKMLINPQKTWVRTERD